MASRSIRIIRQVSRFEKCHNRTLGFVMKMLLAFSAMCMKVMLTLFPFF